MNITSEAIIDMMFSRVMDDDMISLIDALGEEQPVIDEQYEVDRKVVVRSDKYGVNLVFREHDDISSDGSPCLSQIDFKDENKLSLPYGLAATDDYAKCAEKMGGAHQYNQKRLKGCKIWIKKHPCGHTYAININFTELDLLSIRSVVITVFDEDDIGYIYLENK